MSEARMDFESLEGSNKPEQELSDACKYLFEVFDLYKIIMKDSSNGSNSTAITDAACRLVNLAVKSTTPELVQQFIDLGAVNDYNNFVSHIGEYINTLVSMIPDDEIVLDLSARPLEELELGFRLENKILRLLGTGEIHRVGYEAKNCKFFLDASIEWVGTEAEDCEFTFLKTSDDDLGQGSKRCRFYSKEPYERISPDQDGSSRYFVDGKEIGYDHYVDGDRKNGLVHHEPN